MNKTNNGNLAEPGKRNSFELFTEIAGWLQIVASPFLTGLAVGLIIYFSLQNKAGLIIANIIATIGLIAGIVWGNRVWKKKGTIHFMSGIMSTPETDKIKDENEN